jgi:hypothetical protein
MNIFNPFTPPPPFLFLLVLRKSHYMCFVNENICITWETVRKLTTFLCLILHPSQNTVNLVIILTLRPFIHVFLKLHSLTYSRNKVCNVFIEKLKKLKTGQPIIPSPPPPRKICTTLAYKITEIDNEQGNNQGGHPIQNITKGLLQTRPLKRDFISQSKPIRFTPICIVGISMQNCLGLFYALHKYCVPSEKII